MALPHAILVSLCEQSGSGYELARRFDRSIGYFWAATHQQIYRTLRSMEDDGWVRVTPVVQQGRPDKKVYTVSDAGRAELARWIAEPLSGRGSSVADNRTRDIAIKVRGAEYGDVDGTPIPGPKRPEWQRLAPVPGAAWRHPRRGKRDRLAR